MTVAVEFHYDFGSPNTYFCHRVIPEIEERTGVKFKYVPILLGGVFKTTNNKSPMEQFAGVTNKNEYQSLEIARFIKKHKLDKYARNPNFPVNTLHLMRGACYASGKDWEADYIEAMYQCMWEKGLAMGDPAVIVAALKEYDLPAEEIVEATQDPAVKQILIDNTTATVERGSFGSPTFYVGDEIFFGKDRLRDVEEEILAQQ
ncbi:MAG: 2-hydroxychromene-2-carboxylate isomerase [Gammaproteobacteria bacterium]|nr:2-hydroxychromene-2-carboxylate isomerase [Gammaproteobacteria bacterium]MDD9895909.1 2-hydroxychromene-2-carboxylate isomerase [Gammaproteobacteria bacterium]MDD9958343.1 2-hydroxychromene-2-carboxylate isomerase [Gammaproteobacteria bacterium]